MSEGPPTEPIPIAGKTRRLKSLNEFEPPYWLGQFKLPPARKFWPFVAIAMAAGLALGWFVF